MDVVVTPRRDRTRAEGGWAANQIGATAPPNMARSRWSLDFVKKLTTF